MTSWKPDVEGYVTDQVNGQLFNAALSEYQKKPRSNWKPDVKGYVEQQRQEKGREIVRKVLPQVPGLPPQGAGANPYLPNYADIYRPQPAAEVPTYGSNKEFADQIVRQSITRNALAGKSPQRVPEEPRSVTPTTEPSSGRDTPAPQGGADYNAKGTQTSPSSRMDVLHSRLSSPQGDGGFGIPFRFEGNAPTMPGSSNQQQTNTQYATQDEAFAAAYNAGEVTPYLKGYTGDMNDRHAQMSYAYNHGFTGAMDFGRQGANPQAGNSSVPDEAEAQTEVSMPGAETPDAPKPARRRPRGERAGAMFDRQRGFEPETTESTTTGRPRSNRSFLDYDGPGGSMMALRALEASQGTMKQNGVTYGRDSTGKWVQLSDEAAGALKNDRSSVATVDFVDSHVYKPTSKATAEQDEPEIPSLATAPKDYDVPEGASPTFRMPTDAQVPPTAQMQTRDIPYEVKDPQLFLSDRLKKALTGVKATEE